MIKRKKISNSIEPLIPILKKRLWEQQAVLFVYLFGSYGKGKPTPLSDVDIALFLEESLGEIENYTDKKIDLLGIANDVLHTDEVDLVILNEAPLSFRYQVLKTGRLLFSKDERKRIDFETSTLDEYWDTEPLRIMNWKGLVRKVKEDRYGR